MPQLAPHIFELLYQQGVQHAFGIPGDFALTLYDALVENPIKPIVMTHETQRRVYEEVTLYAEILDNPKTAEARSTGLSTMP